MSKKKGVTQRVLLKYTVAALVVAVLFYCVYQISTNLFSDFDVNEGAVNTDKDAYAVAFENDGATAGDAVSSSALPTAEGGSAAELVNINTADAETLMTLKGIGEAKALAIIECRRENGDFRTVYDILEVGGIGEKIFEDIKNFICV